MPTAGEIREQIASESERRSRLAVPAFAGGFLYLLSAIIISETLKGAPTVGLLQGLAPALSGVANPRVSPRVPEVKFVSHHAFALIAGSALAAIAVASLTLIMLLLVGATSFRRPQSWRAARPLVLAGGIAVAVISVGHQVVSAIETHNFVTGHDFSNHAVERALTSGAANAIVDYIDLLAGLALAAGMIATMVNALRVGLATPLDGHPRHVHRPADLPADRRRRAADRAGLLDGDAGHPVRREMAERRTAGVGCGRGAAVAVAGADTRRR